MTANTFLTEGKQNVLSYGNYPSSGKSICSGDNPERKEDTFEITLHIDVFDIP